MDVAHHFSINPERVVHETIDGETIIIQLETGTYYSLSEAGADAWRLLVDGRSTDEVVEDLGERYDATPEEFTEAIAELIAELRREELLELAPDSAERGVPSANGSTNGAGGARAPFTPPTLKKYTDMQYFLMLDPIHEVDGVGWPNPRDE